MKRMRRGKGYSKGSITIEASISLVLFVFLIVSFLGLINIARVQTKVGNALHLTALEISHLSYLYEVTGLYDLDVAVQKAGSEAGSALRSKVDNADKMIKNVENLNGLLSNTIKDIQDCEASEGSLVQAYDQGVMEVRDLKANFEAEKEKVKEIIDNPTKFLETLLKYGIGQGTNAAKNVLAGILAKGLMEEHIMAGGVVKDADAYLKKLGVEDGLSGMHFGASSLYSGKDYTDINLVVMYRVNVFPLLGDHFTMPVAQSASTRAWLQGDASKIVAEDSPGVPDEEDNDEEKETIWTKGNSARHDAITEMIEEEHKGDPGYIRVGTFSKGVGFDKEKSKLYIANSIDVKRDSYKKDDGTPNQPAIDAAVKRMLKTAYKNAGSVDTVNPEGKMPLPDTISIEMEVIVPENATDEEIAAVQKAIDKWKKAHPGPVDGVSDFSIKIVKKGGDSPE